MKPPYYGSRWIYQQPVLIKLNYKACSRLNKFFYFVIIKILFLLYCTKKNNNIGKIIFGLSEGMILAAGPGGKDIFMLSADAGATPGQQVK
jgi:hypothetical protein